MLRLGLVDEVRQLELAGLRDGKTASRALGYAEVLRFLAGEWSLEDAASHTIQATRRFVRRQESWFRRDPRITWLEAGPGLPARALEVIRAGLAGSIGDHSGGERVNGAGTPHARPLASGACGSPRDRARGMTS